MERRLLDQVQSESQYLHSKLFELKEKYPQAISEIRGKGFMIGVELTKPAKEIHLVLLEKKIITNVTANTVLRLLPPLIFSRDNIDVFIVSFDDALSSF